MSPGRIQWVSMNQTIDKMLQPTDIDKQSRLIRFKEIYVLGQTKTSVIGFAPLLARVFVIPDYMMSENNELLYKKEFIKDYVNADLLLPEKIIKRLVPKPPSAFSVCKALRISFSSGCNLNCVYCYGNANHNPVNTSMENIERFVKQHPHKHKIKAVEFHGNGEPTIAMKEIKKATRLIRKEIPNAYIVIQTNGQFDKKTTDWLIQNNIRLGFSIDGPEHIHNAQRPARNKRTNSFKKVVKNIEYFKAHNKRIFVIACVSSQSVSFMPDTYHFLKELGATKILMNPIVSAGRASSNPDLSAQAPDIMEFSRQYAQLLKQAYNDRINLGSSFFPPLIESKTSAIRCSISYPKYMLGVNGDILSCLEAISLDTPEINPFYWGKLEAGQLIINKTKEQVLKKRNTYNMPECKQCFVRWYCRGGCALMSYLEHGDIYKPVDIHCQARKMIAQEFLLFLAQGLLERSRINLQYRTKGIDSLEAFQYKSRKTLPEKNQVEELVKWVKEANPAKTKQVREYIKETIQR